MTKLQTVRGTHDLYGQDALLHRYVQAIATELFELYNFEELTTPIFEFTQVFARTLGEESDVVSKEMYSFEDRGGESITLRPEFTAGIVRAVIQNGLQQNIPLKLFTMGPIFRYERPQKGRMRQFHQLDAEIIGTPSPQADAEIMRLGMDLMDSLGIADKVKVELNTLGDADSRKAYRDALVDYFKDHEKGLSEDSIRRLSINPLRILDSKDEGDRKIIENAPDFRDYQNAISTEFFAELCEELKISGIEYTLNSRLVRGLDYYCHTVFEFVTDALGAQGTVLAGGRYDGLMALMGGPDTPAVGWGAGIERLALLANMPQETKPKIAIVPMSKEAQAVGVSLSHELRQHDLVTDMAYGGNMGKRMKRADKIGAAYALIIGDDELKQKTVTVRDLSSGHQEAQSLEGVAAHLKALLS